MSRLALPFLALALLVACKHEAAKEEKAAPVPVHCQAPTKETVEETVALRGHVEPPPGGDLPVASQVPGRVVSVAVKEGQRIASGELVASIDDAPTRDALRQADAALAQARAADVNAQATLDRTRALVQRGIAAKQELEDAVARAAASKEAVNAAQAAADLARRTLGRVWVRSSFAGVVTRVWRGPGALVDGTAATPVIQLAAATGVEFVADATQRELSAIQPGQSAKGTLVLGDATFEGTVRARSSALDPTTGLGTARVTISSATDGIPVGAYGRVVITTGKREATFVVPSTAIRGAVSDGTEIVLCKDGKAAIKTVKVGWRDEDKVEIVEGLEPGDVVATDHVLGLDDDTPLAEPKPEDEPKPDDKKKPEDK